jgi:hypothetical protein
MILPLLVISPTRHAPALPYCRSPVPHRDTVIEEKKSSNPNPSRGCARVVVSRARARRGRARLREVRQPRVRSRGGEQGTCEAAAG